MLIKVYYDMDYGYPIDAPLDLLKIDTDYPIYISRRSLKHFVERRKEEMANRYAKEEIFERFQFAIENVIRTYNSYDEIQAKSLTRLIYTKHHIDSSGHSLRLVMDTLFDHFEICSIHFKKRKTLP